MHIRCSECGHDNSVKNFVVTSLKTFFTCGSCKSKQALSIVVEPTATIEMEGDGHETEAQARRGRTMNKLSQCFKDIYEKQEEVFTPVLPVVATEAMGVVNAPDADSQTLARCIERDQVIAARVLRMANSAFYKGMQKVTDLKTAVTRLGMKQVSSVVMGSVAKELHRSKDMLYNGMMEKLWDHALMCGVASREISAKSGFQDVETAFVAGLLHDIGKVVLLGIGSEVAQGHIETEEPVTEELLMEVLAEIHCETGQDLMQKWDMHDDLTGAVAFHHEPWLAEESAKLANIVNLADFFCKKLDNALVPETNVNLASERSAEVLGLSEINLADIEVELEDRTNEMKQVL
jgi:HD-like signal output (HDOD) protein